jgi:hypothetical protein
LTLSVHVRLTAILRVEDAMRIACKSLGLCLFLSALTVPGVAQCRTSCGTWTAELSKDQSGKLQFRLTCSQDAGSMGHPLSLSELQGLDPAAIQGKHAPVKFSLVREAGSLQFQGVFHEGAGDGEFTFTANQEFLSAMKQMGYPQASEKAFTLASIDVTRAYVLELRALGFRPDLDQVIEARVFNVNRDQVDGLKAAGVRALELGNLVQYRIFNVTPEYIQQMRASFPGISLEKMTEMRIHHVTAEFRSEMSRLGYSGLSVDQLIAFRIHNVTPDYIQQMDKLGLNKLEADQLVQLRIFNVNASQVEDLAKEGYKNLSAQDLVNFRIHRIDSEFIETVKKAGYPHPTPDELVGFRIMGIRHRSAGL